MGRLWLQDLLLQLPIAFDFCRLHFPQDTGSMRGCASPQVTHSQSLFYFAFTALFLNREVCLSQSALLEIEAPIKICSDILGQYHDLLRLFEYGGFSPESILLVDYTLAAAHSGRVGTHS